MPGRKPRRPENALQLLTRGYGWLPDRRRATGSRTVGARLGGLPVTAIEGPDAARFLYDEDHVRRAHAIPEPVQGTLFGKGAVHTLDGEAHRVRKAMFVGLLMHEDGIASLVQQVTAAWDDAVEGWTRRPDIVLFDEAGHVVAGAVCRWAGIPVADDEVPGSPATCWPWSTGSPRAGRGTSGPGGRAAGGRPGSANSSATSAAGCARCPRDPPSPWSPRTAMPAASSWSPGSPRWSCSTSSGRRRRWRGSRPSPGTR
ncbi:hypothetical protein [Blastococcus brunescens]|uniref:Cytochrome P450 n=1 Tax=Blastococcus brunescens TaxID=1564165 RepID=A0ABZ1AY22_9ACTN|nr:hypothetical protein [Blastococcus sp. BMG 8361]WRL62318.1 hypothetical protein U6N30_20085 [Blastococcus sp. BMG 8361]